MDPKTREILDRIIFGPRPEPDRDARRLFAKPPFLPTPDGQEVDFGHLQDWIGRLLERGDLPIYKLAAQLPDLALPLGPAQPFFSQQRMDASGLWRVLVMPTQTLGLEAASSAGFETVRDAALLFDRRQGEPFGVESTVIVRSARSRLIDHDLPVLGPGGHVTAYRFESQSEVDVVMRKREGALSATARRVDDVAYAFVERILALSPGALPPRFWGAFGYFELSKYERQAHMRPSFVVTVTFQDEQGAALWSSTFVEPASTSPEISPSEGLGSWA